MGRIFRVIILVLISGSLRFAAADPHPSYLSFEDAVKFALDGNPDLGAFRAQEDAIKLRSKQALAPGDPVFSYQAQDTPGFNPSIQPAEAVYQVNFTLGFPGKALAQSANLRHQAEVAREQASAKEIDLILSLSNNYVAFFINDTFYHLLKDEEGRDERLLKLLEKKFSTSQAAKVDLLNAKVVIAQLHQDLLANRNEYEVLTTQFRQIIKKPERTDLYPKVPKEITVPPLKLTFEELSKKMLKNSQSILGAEHQVEATQSALTLASLQPLPDFQLMTSVNVWNTTQGPPIAGVTRDYTFGLGITVPIFFPFSQLTGIQAARKDMAAADFQAQSQRLSSIANLQTTYTSFKAAQLESDNLSHLVVPAAKASYDLTLLTYSLGKADFFQLNSTRKAWFDSQKDLLTKKQSVAQYYNQFISEVGCDLTKAGGPHECTD